MPCGRVHSKRHNFSRRKRYPGRVWSRSDVLGELNDQLYEDIAKNTPRGLCPAECPVEVVSVLFTDKAVNVDASPLGHVRPGSTRFASGPHRAGSTLAEHIDGEIAAEYVVEVYCLKTTEWLKVSDLSVTAPPGPPGTGSPLEVPRCGLQLSGKRTYKGISKRVEITAITAQAVNAANQKVQADALASARAALNRDLAAMAESTCPAPCPNTLYFFAETAPTFRDRNWVSFKSGRTWAQSRCELSVRLEHHCLTGEASIEVR